MSRSRPLLIVVVAASVLVAVALLSSESEAPPPAAKEGSGRIGIYLTSHALTIPEVVEGFLAANEAGKIDTLVINVKNMHGELTYASDAFPAKEIGASTGRIDFELLLPELHRRGFYVIARQVVFFDPLLAKHLGLPGDFVPADTPIAREYNLGIAEEVASFGFDEIQFDYIRYNDVGALEAVYDTRYEAIETFLAAARERLEGRVALSADLFGRVLWPWNQKRIDPIGQSLEGIAPHVDFISPMLYPSHYVEASYRDDPYGVVHAALTGGTERVAARFRPFLQAFDLAIPDGMTMEEYIAAQIRAAEETGADGYLFWHPACDYAALYNVL